MHGWTDRCLPTARVLCLKAVRPICRKAASLSRCLRARVFVVKLTRLFLERCCCVEQLFSLLRTYVLRHGMLCAVQSVECRRAHSVICDSPSWRACVRVYVCMHATSLPSFVRTGRCGYTDGLASRERTPLPPGQQRAAVQPPHSLVRHMHVRLHVVPLASRASRVPLPQMWHQRVHGVRPPLPRLLFRLQGWLHFRDRRQ